MTATLLPASALVKTVERRSLRSSALGKALFHAHTPVPKRASRGMEWKTAHLKAAR